MRTIRLIYTFYRSFFIASILVTLACIAIINEHGLKALGSLLWIKIFTLGLIFLFIRNYKRKEFFYYQNLGISKKRLWISVFTVDILLFFCLSILTVLLS